jgi:high-affinity iron transporter
MVVAQYLLTFREVLEAALLTAIILAFLAKTGRVAFVRHAWYGVYGATAGSLVIGAAIWLAYGQLPTATRILFEGIAAIIAVSVLTSMIYWMAAKGRSIRREIEGRLETAATQGALLGVASVTFVLVFREGLETVLFLTPFLVQDAALTLLGASLGLGAGLALAYAIFRVGLKLDIRRFFYFTSVLLVLVAGGLLGYGVHELVEYATDVGGADLGWWASAAYNLGLADSDLLHNKGFVGSVFAVMFGYDTDPEWARVVAHGIYLALVMPLVVLMYRRPEIVAQWSRRIRAVFRGPKTTPTSDS